MASVQQPAAILFDAGGTLVLQDPGEMSARLGTTIDELEAHMAHYTAMAEYSSRRIGGEALGWEWWLERYFDLLGVDEPHLAGERIQHGYGLWNTPIAGVADAIGHLLRRGIRVAVVSNSDGSVGESLERAGLSHLFEFVIDSHQVGISKPEPGIFEAALDRLGLEANETWFVGDSVFHDVHGALGVSMAKAVLVDPYGLGPKHVPRVSSVGRLAVYGTG